MGKGFISNLGEAAAKCVYEHIYTVHIYIVVFRLCGVFSFHVVWGLVGFARGFSLACNILQPCLVVFLTCDQAKSFQRRNLFAQSFSQMNEFLSEFDII